MRWLAIVLVVLCAWAASPATAQSVAPHQEITAGELEDLAAALEDPARRADLVGKIKALVEVKRGTAEESPVDGLGARLIATLVDSASLLGVQVAAFSSLLADLPLLGAWAESQVTNIQARELWFALAFNLVLLVAAGMLAERLAIRLLRRPRAALETRQTARYILRVPLALARILLDILPIVAFYVAANAVLPLTRSDPKVYVVAFTVINANIVVRALLALARAILMPAMPSLRLLPASDETANYLYIWVRRFVQIGVIGYFIAEAALLLGLPTAGYRGALRLLGLLVAGMAAVLVLQNRAAVADWLRGEDDDRNKWVGTVRHRLAAVWHVLAIVYIVGIYLVWALAITGGFEFIVRATVVTVIILAVARFALTALHRIVDRAFSISPEMLARFPGLDVRANRYLSVLRMVFRVAIYVVAALGILEAWGLDVFAAMSSPAGARVTEALATIAFVLFLAILVWEAVSSAIEGYLKQVDGNGVVVTRSARARTLLPLARNALLVFLVVVVGLIVLSEVGINIAPLLAGAGVLGLAVGFGSQKMVQDVITGAFILFEDTISVGDVVSLGGLTGVVEAMSVRSIRLRALDGSVHTVPFSAVSTVTNMTKDYSFYVLDVGIGYRENVDEVIEVLRGIGDEMRADPAFAPLMLEPLEVMGLDKFADSAVIIRARLKTLPIKQWVVGREFNRRMKKVFDERGIEIPFPHTTVYFGEDKKGAAPPLRLRTEDAQRLQEELSSAAADSASTMRSATS